MKTKFLFIILFFISYFFSEVSAQENLIICNEGIWQSDNGRLSYYNAQNGTMTNEWFRSINGIKLGDTPNDK